MKASVFVVTYNQENYIRQCLDSILMQQVDFDFEVVIGEDHGTDGTRAICEEYVDRYPQVRLLPLMERLGIARNWKRVLEECKGEYIALCEADDYWIDPHKLQMQIDLMDSKSEVGYVFTKCYCEKLSGERFDYFETVKNKMYDPPIVPLSDLHYLLSHGIMPTTQTVCIRSSLLPKPMPDFMTGHLYADLMLLVIVACNGCKIAYIDKFTAVYRLGGITSRVDGYKSIVECISIRQKLNEYSNYKYDYTLGDKSSKYKMLYKIWRPYRRYYIRAYYCYVKWHILKYGFNRTTISQICKATIKKVITFFRKK